MRHKGVIPKKHIAQLKGYSWFQDLPYDSLLTQLGGGHAL